VRTVIALSSVPVAIVTNGFRVAGTGIAAHQFGPAAAEGFFHEFSGWVIYIAAFLMLFGVAWIVDRFKPTTASASVDEKVDTRAAQVIPMEGAE